MIEVRPAAIPAEVEVVRALFRAYAASIGIDLGFQHFEEELAGLPGAYAEPRGTILLALDASSSGALGCVALRALEGERVAEMKRLYVDPRARGRGVGQLLAEAIVARAKALGYATMRLDTLASMDAARAIYRTLGFVAIGAYCVNPFPDAVFLELDLTRHSPSSTDITTGERNQPS